MWLNSKSVCCLSTVLSATSALLPDSNSSTTSEGKSDAFSHVTLQSSRPNHSTFRRDHSNDWSNHQAYLIKHTCSSFLLPENCSTILPRLLGGKLPLEQPRAWRGLCLGQNLLFCSGVSKHPVFTFPGNPAYSTNPAWLAAQTSLRFIMFPSKTSTDPHPTFPHR